MKRVSVGVGTALIIVGIWATTVFAQSVITVNTLTDTADPPFNADGFCGSGTFSNLPGADGLVSLREAIIAANNTAGAQTITFAPGLSGGTIFINFDDLDADTNPDQLPNLCGGDTTINGDLNGDNVPDITLDGSALLAGANGIVIISGNNTANGLEVQNFPGGGIGVFHLSSFGTTASNNTISNNIVSGGTVPIFVQAGFANTLGRLH